MDANGREEEKEFLTGLTGLARFLGHELTRM